MMSKYNAEYNFQIIKSNFYANVFEEIFIMSIIQCVCLFLEDI